MTADQLHDALTLLPADLIAEADAVRNRKPKRISWRPFASMAACFILLVGCGLLCMAFFGAGGGYTEQAAAEAPMMQAESHKEAPAEIQRDSVSEEAPAAADPGTNDLCGVPTAPASGQTATTENSLCIDHAHIPAEPAEETGGAWCGNMTATVYFEGKTHSLSGTDAVTLTDILYRLEYREEDLCRCAAELTVDTEMGTGYALSPGSCFARFGGGQAALTQAQADAIREILDRLP